jgi:hypothetical protein
MIEINIMIRQIEIYKSSTNFYFRFKPEVEVSMFNDKYYYIMCLKWCFIANNEFIDYYDLPCATADISPINIKDKEKITFKEALDLYTYLAEVKLRNESDARPKLLSVMQLIIAKWGD